MVRVQKIILQPVNCWHPVHWTVIFPFFWISFGVQAVFGPQAVTHKDTSKTYRSSLSPSPRRRRRLCHRRRSHRRQRLLSSKVAAIKGYLFIFLGFHFASSFFSDLIILIFYWDEPVRDFFVNNLKPAGKSSLSRFYSEIWEIWEILLFPN